MPLKVALLYNVKSEETPEEGEPPDQEAEFDSPATIAAIRQAIESLGHEAIPIEANRLAYERLLTTPVDLAFNISEGYWGRNREAHIPACLEMLNIPYTGSDVLTLALALDKGLTKKILAYHRIPTAPFQIIASPEEELREGLHFPLFVKPCYEGSSKGIEFDSRVEQESSFRQKVAELFTAYRQPVLVEEFLPGREFTVGIIGNDNPLILPIREINYDHCPAGTPPVYSHYFKVHWDDPAFYLCPAPLTLWEEKRIKDTALAAYRAVGCRDLGRVDIRLDKEGTPCVMEINPLPGLAPGFSDFPLAAEAAGLTYRDMIGLIIEAACRRYQIQTVELAPAVGLTH